MTKRLGLIMLLLLLPALSAQADIRGKEVVNTYAVSGVTGRALYDSIGERGPKVGIARAIAHTTFDLKWGRDYVREGNACVLAAARPFLTITYTLPQPSGNLPPAVAARWRVFIAGIRAHEAVHGEYVRALAQEIYDTTVGFRQENDPGCKAIRQAIQTPLKQAVARYKARNRAFEEAEMARNGPILHLILELIE